VKSAAAAVSYEHQDRATGGEAGRVNKARERVKGAAVYLLCIMPNKLGVNIYLSEFVKFVDELIIII
jgi:hypothetical protein